MKRRLLLASLCLAASATAATAAQAADAYPNRPVKILVGFSPGGATDQLARLYAVKLTEKLGQSFVVDNRPGAGGNIAVQTITQSPPDGYTLAMAANYISVNAALKRNPYDSQKDLRPIALIASTPNLLVVPANSPIRTLQDLQSAIKQPKGVTFGSPGVGSSVHMAGELFKSLTGGNMTHVPYKGVSPAEVDLIGGNIDIMFDSTSTAIPLVKAGKLRAIAATGMQRIQALPNVPTIDEAGLKGFDVGATYMLVAPTKTPQDVVNRIAKAVAEVTAQADVQRFIGSIFAIPLQGGPEQTRAFLDSEEAKWVKVVQATGVKAE